MRRKITYERAKAKLLADESVCARNRELFAQFFEFEEYKLKRQNGLRELDEGCYKTLRYYVTRFRNVNAWFGNKAWGDLTREDIKRVYDDLEDGRIRTRLGRPFEDRTSYYHKVFKSKPFRLAGKSEVAKEVIEFYTGEKKDVRFVQEKEFRKVLSVISKPSHLFLLWLAWDVGENIMTLLRLTTSDFRKEHNASSGRVEYLVRLPREKLKRSRRARTEPTLHPETVMYADMVLSKLGEDERVFPFGYAQAAKILRQAVRKSGAICLPYKDEVTWKDLRSGMACHLLRNGWSSDEVNARLGHTPRSSALDRYINYLALDRERPKRKLEQATVEGVKAELATVRQREVLAAERIRRHEAENRGLREELERTRDELGAVGKMVLELRGLIGGSLKDSPPTRFVNGRSREESDAGSGRGAWRSRRALRSETVTSPEGIPQDQV